MLANRKYIGEYRYQDIIIPDGVPASVPEELFYRVQERRDKIIPPARSKTENEILLTTKLFCGKCERMMVGESGTSHTGQTYYYYKCGSAKRKRVVIRKLLKKIGLSALWSN